MQDTRQNGDGGVRSLQMVAGTIPTIAEVWETRGWGAKDARSSVAEEKRKAD